KWLRIGRRSTPGLNWDKEKRKMCCGSKRMQLKSSPRQESGPVSRPAAEIGRDIDRAQRQWSTRGGIQMHPKMSTSPAHLGDSVQAAAGGSSVAAPVGPTVALSCLERLPLRVQGLSSGRTYEFSDTQTVQHVDPRDATAMLNTSRFRLV